MMQIFVRQITRPAGSNGSNDAGLISRAGLEGLRQHKPFPSIGLPCIPPSYITTTDGGSGSLPDQDLKNRILALLWRAVRDSQSAGAVTPYATEYIAAGIRLLEAGLEAQQTSMDRAVVFEVGMKAVKSCRLAAAASELVPGAEPPLLEVEALLNRLLVAAQDLAEVELASAEGSHDPHILRE